MITGVPLISDSLPELSIDLYIMIEVYIVSYFHSELQIISEVISSKEVLYTQQATINTQEM